MEKLLKRPSHEAPFSLPNQSPFSKPVIDEYLLWSLLRKDKCAASFTAEVASNAARGQIGQRTLRLLVDHEADIPSHHYSVTHGAILT